MWLTCCCLCFVELEFAAVTVGLLPVACVFDFCVYCLV